MDKDILEQYLEIKGEIRDLKERIDRDQHRLERIKAEGVVSDTVRGTRKDGTIGPIKITGYPLPEADQVKNMIKKRVLKLHILEDELQEAVNAGADVIISGAGLPMDLPELIGKSDLRMMFRFYYLDDMTWAAVAINMNYRFPKRRIKYTEDNCRIRHDRYLKDNLGKL